MNISRDCLCSCLNSGRTFPIAVQSLTVTLRAEALGKGSLVDYCHNLKGPPPPVDLGFRRARETVGYL